LWATTKKVINFFGEEKCTPRQNPGYALERAQKSAEDRSHWRDLARLHVLYKKKTQEEKVSKKWTHVARINTTRHSLDQTDAPSTSDAQSALIIVKTAHYLGEHLSQSHWLLLAIVLLKYPAVWSSISNDVQTWASPRAGDLWPSSPENWI